jgi:hypothetical protein
MQKPAQHWEKVDLFEALQDAIDLEFATIPPYLCAQWSIIDPAGDGLEAAKIIRGVVREEMRHMGLVCNLLAGIGGAPSIVAPRYPGPLPGNVRPGLTICLEGLSICAVRNVFMQIEYPEHGPVPIPQLVSRRYATIGEFYDAVLAAFETLKPSLDPARQLEDSRIGLVKLKTKEDVRKAIIDTIKVQGEGTCQSPFSQDIAGRDELAHYYRFWQIAEERMIEVVNKKAKWGPAGSLPFPAVYPMAPVPRRGYPDTLTGTFNHAYREMIANLQSAWEIGDTPDGTKQLRDAVAIMRKLKDLALPLLKKEIAPHTGNYGPDFRGTVVHRASFSGPLNSYSDVRKLFNDYVAANHVDLTFSPHHDFWNSLTYDQFVAQDVPGVAGVPILKRRDGNGSNLVRVLRGPIAGTGGPIPRMPSDGSAYMSDDQIAALATWIDRDCPQ